MKVCINIKKLPGPFGGGMVFARDLEDFLVHQGECVVHALNDEDIDNILHVNPFPFLMKSAAFSCLDAYRYQLKHPQTVIVQGIHECDERKDTHYMNRLLVKASWYCDFIVYVSSWLEPLLKKNGLDPTKPSKVILHGSSKKIFNTEGKTFWHRQGPLKLVTHHWGGHYLKGHDFYQRIDALLNMKEWGEKISFTYIGSHPKNLVYKNTKLIPPLSGKELGEELKKHDVYITASRNEPAGLHHIEGALCGLPLLYIDSGALKEYCEGYGLEFDKHNFEKKLQEMYDHYEHYLKQIKLYERTSEKMGQQYFDLLNRLYRERIPMKKRTWVYFQIFFYTIYNFYFDKEWRAKNKIIQLTRFFHNQQGIR